MGNYGIDILLE